MLHEQKRLTTSGLKQKLLLSPLLLRQGLHNGRQPELQQIRLPHGSGGGFGHYPEASTCVREQPMKLLIHGRNLKITQAISDYTKDKLSRAVAKFEGLISEAEVHLSVAKNPSVQQQTAEVTIFANGAVIRAEERSENLYASIDLVSSKLSRQLRRYKERIRDHHRAEGNRSDGESAALNGSSEAIERLNAQGQSRPALPTPAVRRKYFAMPPMTLEQAITQLELVDHDFYVFRDREDRQIRVVYRRNHGGYGVIEPRG